MPDQMNLPFALIHKKFGKTLGLSTMPLYLKRWGLTAQRPLTRATPRDPQRIATWRAQDYPRIEAREGGDLLERRGRRPRPGPDRPLRQELRRYGPQGQTPILTQTRQTFSMSMIAAVSNRGLMRFTLYEGALNGAIFIDFMTRLVSDAKQKVFLIVGDPRVHLASFDKNSGVVQEWLAHHKDEIEIFTLPADAPEHTRMNISTTISSRRSRTSRPPGPAMIPLRPTSSFLKSIPSRPDRIKSSFHAKHLRYAA
jgi:hypothetical protein